MSLSSLFDQLSAEGPGIDWPKVLSGQTASLFTALYDLSRIERLSSDRLEQLQDAQLERLLKHAATQVPYYQDCLRRAGFRAGKTKVGEIWKAIPVLTRADIQDQGPRLRAKSYPKSHGALRERSTSGSTSRPVRIVTTELTDFFWMCANMRDRMWHDVDLGGTLVLLTDGAAKMGGRPVVELASWSLPAPALRKSGKQFKINPALRVGDQVREIRKLSPAYIQTRPSQLNLLVKECQAAGTRFDGLRAIFCLSEVVPDTLRQACHDVLGATLVECYSCAEMGYLALQCPDTGKLHVQSETVRVEVLRADNALCAIGEIGRVVVTSLHNYAMPLIRYELGDEAEVGAACACGRGLPVIEKIVGRTQDYLILPSGDPIRANTYHNRIAAMPAILEFQIVQRSTSLLEIRLVVDKPLEESETQRLTSLLRHQGHHVFDVEITYRDSIERTESGKLRSFICEVA